MNQTAIETTKDIATLNLEMEPQKSIKDRESQFEAIRDIVIEHYSLSWDDIYKPGRLPINVLARGLIYYFMRELTTAALEWSGSQFLSRNASAKGLDHSTVLNGIKVVTNRLSYDKVFNREFEIIKAKIYSHPVFID